MIHFLSKADKKDLTGTAIVRLDFNTEDDWRMKTALPTLKFLLRANVKILVVSHKGRPTAANRSARGGSSFGGKSQIANKNKFSLKKDAGFLGKLLGKKVHFIPHFRFGEIKKILDKSPTGSVFVLENIRFLKEEYQNSPVLAKKLAGLGNFFVNDGFAISHRKDASVAAITRFLPSYAGLGLEAEMKNLSHVMRNPKKPLVLVVGGGKPSDKVEILKNFHGKANRIILGGAVANTILAARGLNIGESVADLKNKNHYASIARYKNIVLPVDFRIRGKKILDIGLETEKLFAKEIGRAGTVIWNGPLGLMEDKNFRRGTLAVARAVAKNKKCFSLVGGGETVMFLKKHKLDKKFSFVSTGGGAMLEFLANKKLPGIKALDID